MFLNRITVLFVTIILSIGLSSNVIAIENEAALDIITVTADRREENILDVPSSIQVFDAYTLEERAYENNVDLVKAVPNVNAGVYRVGSGELTLNIRGVGAGTTAVNVDQAVGVYIDNVPVSSITEFEGEYLDVEQIEILRGPQGTLYGRNALSGVLHIKTTKPKAEESKKISAYYGTNNKKRVSGIVNTQLGEGDTYARFSFTKSENDAYIDNISTGVGDVGDKKVNAFRGKILFNPNQETQVLVSADISNKKEAAGTGPYNEVLDQGVDQLRIFNSEKEDKGLSVEVEKQLNKGKFISLSSYRKHKSNATGSAATTQGFDPAIPATIYLDDDSIVGLDKNTLTQELRFESNDNKQLSWIGGVYYQNNNATRLSGFVNRLANVGEESSAKLDDSSIALFGDGTYKLSKKSSITVGGRYSYDTKKMDYRHEGSLAPVFGQSLAPEQTLNTKETFTDFAPRLVFEYKPEENTNLYAKVSKGYKAGGFNQEFIAQLTPFKKETVISYELGMKKKIGNNTQLEANIFTMDWKDQQALVFDGITAGFMRIENAKKSKSKGLELQLTTRLNRHWLLTGSAAYLDAKFVDAKRLISQTEDADGNYQPNAPKRSGALSARYEQDLAGGNIGFFSADATYKSDFYWDIANTLKEPSHTLLNLSAGVEADDYEIRAFVKNAMDKKYRTGAYPAAAGFYDDAQGAPGNGREVGIRTTFNF